MQLLETTDINARYDKGLAYLTNITYNKFVKDKYGVQYKSSKADRYLLMLMYAMDSWDNRSGAINWLTSKQMSAVLDNIAYAHRDSLTAMCSSSAAGDSIIASSNYSFSVMDSSSIHLSYVNGILSAQLIVSTTAGNNASVTSNGLFVGGGSGSSGGKIFLTGDDFNAGTNVYDNTALAGITSITVWHRGLGFLLYDFNNPSNANNEFRILDTGGIEIIIPGFDVHDGNNFFYILY